MCEFCNTYRVICEQMAQFVPDTGEHRCPSCGSIVLINLSFVDVDGEQLLYERLPSEKKDAPTPLKMEIDIDNVDISRELELLSKKRPAGYGDEYLKKKWEEFNREEETKTKPLTPEEFHQEMRNIRDKWYDNYDDEEVCHSCMDDLMCELLTSLGYGDGVDVFNNTPKWYA